MSTQIECIPYKILIFYNKHRTAEVIADNVYFGDSKKESLDGPSAQNFYSHSTYSASNNTTPSSDFALIEDVDTQLPF